MSKKKGKGIKRTNKAQQTSIHNEQPTTTKTLKRVDKCKQSVEAPKKKGVARKDKNSQSSEPVKTKQIKRQPGKQQSQSTEDVKKKVIKRRDVTQTSVEKTKKVIPRQNLMHQSGKGEEPQRKAIARKPGMNERSEKLGLESKPRTKKNVCDPNKTVAEPVKTKKIVRSSNRNATSSKEVVPSKGKRGGAKGAAFQTSTEEAKVGRKLKTGAGKMQQRSCEKQEPKVNKKKPIKTKNNQMTTSNNIFSGGSSGGKSSQPSKNVSHMQSSFQFG